MPCASVGSFRLYEALVLRKVIRKVQSIDALFVREICYDDGVIKGDLQSKAVATFLHE
jgi:hypothetical protein